MGFQENIALPDETLLSSLSSKEGEVFNSESIRKDISIIAHQYGEKGYAFATASPLTELHRDTRTVDITWDITEGQRVYIGEINIVGNTRTRDNVIRREVRLNEGDQYNIAKIDRSKVRIRNTGFFEDVQVFTERRPGEQVVDMEIGVKEQQTGSLSFGLGASSTQGLVGSFDIKQKNFLGTGRELNLAAMLGGEDSTFSFRFVEPWLFDTEVSLGASIFKTTSDYDSFEEDTVGGSIIFGRALDEYSRGTLVFDYEEIDFSDVDETFETATADTQSVFGITLGWRRNTVANIIDPTKGYLARASAKFASLLADADFNKYFISDRFFIQGPGKLVLSLNGELGYVDADNGEDVPLSELYFLGGIESVRGYQYRSLGPRNFIGNQIGGRKVIVLNTELHFPVAPAAGLRGFLFFDVGKLYDPVIVSTAFTAVDADGDGVTDFLQETILPNLTDGDVWKKSYGIGISWRSPAGPIKIIWANAMDEEDFDELETIQFSLGTTF
jgi:outer membrane protein insertion porin family